VKFSPTQSRHKFTRGGRSDQEHLFIPRPYL
jgi:hypothetical protein